MNTKAIKYWALLLLLPLLQLGIFNNILLLGYINPLVYVIFIFVYPIDKNKTSLLIASFLLGIAIDLLTNDGGIHAFSLVFVAYIRLFFLQLISGKSASDLEEVSIQNISFSLVILWIISITFIHHFLVFLLEQFSFVNFGSLLLKTLLTTSFSAILIIFGLQLFSKKKSNA